VIELKVEDVVVLCWHFFFHSSCWHFMTTAMMKSYQKIFWRVRDSFLKHYLAAIYYLVEKRRLNYVVIEVKPCQVSKDARISYFGVWLSWGLGIGGVVVLCWSAEQKGGWNSVKILHAILQSNSRFPSISLLKNGISGKALSCWMIEGRLIVGKGDQKSDWMSAI
jgi:hypothetical protein